MIGRLVVEKYSPGIPILTYHSLADSGSIVSTSPALFERQMEALWRRGYLDVVGHEAVRIARENQKSEVRGQKSGSACRWASD